MEQEAQGHDAHLRSCNLSIVPIEKLSLKTSCCHGNCSYNVADEPDVAMATTSEICYMELYGG